MQGNRKFLSEFAVNLFSARWLLIPSSQIGLDGNMGGEEEDASSNCHIYLICQYPAASFDKESFEYRNGCVSGKVIYRVEGKSSAFDFRSEYPLLDDATQVQLSRYPHREIHSLNAAGEVVRYLPASSLCFHTEVRDNHPDLCAFKVLYVGQAFAEGRRSALDRLQSHSTLQKILAQGQYNNPDCEIFILMFEYVPYRLIAQMDGRARRAIRGERDSDRFFSILQNPLTQHQQVCLAEAALIRYFSPEYNVAYKESFPSETHMILQQCYALDFSALIVEINTEDLGFTLRSDTIPPKQHHIAQIDLLGRQERLGFFHLSDGLGSYVSTPGVIR
jgi:hypothetical protein